MSVFPVISPDIVAEAVRVKTAAEQNRSQNTTMIIPPGFVVSYRIEAGRRHETWLRHMSVFVETDDGRTVPSPAAMKEILALFNFSSSAPLPPDPLHVTHALEKLWRERVNSRRRQNT